MLSRKLPKLLFIGAIGFLLCVNVAWADPVVSVSPSSQTVNPGDTFSVDIVVSGLTDTLQAFNFDLGFDSAVLTATAVTDGGFFAGFPTILVSNPEADLAAPDVNFSLSALSLGPPSNNIGTPLASITFDVLSGAAPGASTLTLNDVNLFGVPPLFGLPPTITSSSVNGSVTISGSGGPAIPEPSTILLLGTGLAGLGLYRWRKQ